MSKIKWHSKLVNLAVALTLVASLAGIAVLPVGAVDSSFASGSIAIVPDEDFCCCDNFAVNVTVEAAGADALNWTAELSWTGDEGGGDVDIVSGPNYSPATQNLTAGATGYIEWEMHCDGPDDVKFEVTVSADNYDDLILTSDWVKQSSAFLEVVNVTIPEEAPVCTCFNVTFQFKNTGCANMTDIFGWLYALDEAEFGCPPETQGTEEKTGFLDNEAGGDVLEPGDVTEVYTVQMHCTGTGLAGIHIIPYGNDACGNEIEGKSNISKWTQVFGVECDVEPNPTKVCHNTTFTAIVGDGAEYNVEWEWDFDGNGSIDDSGTSSIPTIETEWHYDDPGNYTACVNVTDQSGTTVQCCKDVRVYPALNVTCDVEPLETKVPHCLNFTAERDGGIPGLDYIWSWEITDEDTSVIVDTAATQDYEFCPASAGNYSGTITLTDDLEPANTANCTTKTARVYPGLNVTCAAEPEIIKIPHCVNFTAERVGGIPSLSYTWSWEIWNDDLGAPTGDTASTQDYNWCPSNAGNYTGIVTLADNFQPSNEASCNVSVRVYPGLNVTCDAEPDPAHVCHAVNFTAEVTGGMPGASYNWTWVFKDEDTSDEVGTSNEQNPSFTFMCVGNYSGFVEVCDNLTPPNCANCTANVTVIMEAPALISPPNMHQLTSKNVTFEWEDIGCCNYTLQVWQKEADGQKVWLVQAGHENSWTLPVFNGEWRWQVTATDSCNVSATSDTWFFRVDQPGPSVTVMSPNGGEVWQSGDSHAITWTAAPTDGVIDIYYSSDNGENWILIKNGEENDGAYAWTVPSVDSDQCLVRVIVSDSASGSAQDTSDDVFTITTDLTDPTVVVTNPDGGESYLGGSSQSITWTATDNVGVTSIGLYFSSNGGAEWAIIATGEANDGTYSWTVPGVESDQCLVKAEASDAAGNVGSDTSDAVFSITITEETPPSVTVKTPNGGETWAGGSRQSITWKASDYWPTGGFAASADSDLIINIYYKYGGGAWMVIATGEVNDGEYKWDVPEINDAQCLVRVDAVDAAGNVGSDTSDDEFTIITGVVVSIPDTAVSANTSAIVPININGVTDLASVNIWLTYDKDVVTVANVTAGTLGAVSFSIDNTSGVTKINWFMATGGKIGDFVFANVELQAVGSAGESSALDLDVKGMSDPDGNPIAHSVEDGVFTILALMEGDANLDSHVTIVDAMFVAQHLVGYRTLTPDQLKCADTFGDDGTVDIADAMYIARWLVDPTTPLWDATKDADMLPPVP